MWEIPEASRPGSGSGAGERASPGESSPQGLLRPLREAREPGLAPWEGGHPLSPGLGACTSPALHHLASAHFPAQI